MWGLVPPDVRDLQDLYSPGTAAADRPHATEIRRIFDRQAVPAKRRRGPRNDSHIAWSRWTLAIGAGALVVRVLVVLGQPLRLFSDDADYQRLAVSLATGHGWGITHVAPGGGPTAFRPPIFPLVLAGVYRVFGVHLLAARIFEAALGAVAVILLIVLTEKLWGRKAAYAAGMVAAVFPPLLLASTSLMSESLAVPLEISALLAIFAFRGSRHARWALLSGALLGLLVLTRTEAIVLAIPVVGLAFRVKPARALDDEAARGRFGDSTLWRTAIAPLAVLLAMAIVIAPWEIRDRVVMKAWVPLTTQSGYVLAGTYNHTSQTQVPGAWRPANYDPADKALIADHPHAGEVKLDKVLESSAIHYAASHPGYVATVFYENTLRLFDFSSLSVAQGATYSSYGYPSIWGDAEAISGVGILILAIWGLALRRGRRPESGQRIPTGFWAAPLLLWVSTVLQEAFPRLRALIDPFLVQLAAVALVALAAAVRQRVPSIFGPVARSDNLSSAN